MSTQKQTLSPISNRREFAQASAGLAALGCAAMGAETQAAGAAPAANIVARGNTIVFQGDSITDSGRDRKAAGQANKQPPLGKGYAWLAAAAILVNRPDDEIKIFNRGISGNKVFQLSERWQQDCLDLKPDVLSILIGVNDIWHGLNGEYEGTVEIYERDYHALVERTREALPNIRLVVCEPFVLRCGAVNDKWFPTFDEYRAAARRVSDAAGAIFVPFQSMFERAIQFAPPEHWAGDGVHPTADGAAMLAQCWLRAVGS